MKVVILCGGKGTRLREETEFRPKPMLPIGNRPILWHIMKIYAAQGHKDFILCLGYKGEMIKDYFRNYLWNVSNITLDLGREPKVTFHNRHDEEDWRVTLADTGEASLTATRIRKIREYLDPKEPFLLTYGDGVGNIDVNASIRQHRKSKKICTITAVHPPGRFGEIDLLDDNTIRAFNEKPQVEEGLINGGYMVCGPKVLDYLPAQEDAMFEHHPLQKMASDGVLGAYRHEGFWQPMDTFQEFALLNKLWDDGKAPWKVW
jgi:glucose-1-phosphate cytidylyltransferase